MVQQNATAQKTMQAVSVHNVLSTDGKAISCRISNKWHYPPLSPLPNPQREKIIKNSTDALWLSEPLERGSVKKSPELLQSIINEDKPQGTSKSVTVDVAVLRL